MNPDCASRLASRRRKWVYTFSQHIPEPIRGYFIGRAACRLKMARRGKVRPAYVGRKRRSATT